MYAHVSNELCINYHNSNEDLRATLENWIAGINSNNLIRLQENTSISDRVTNSKRPGGTGVTRARMVDMGPVHRWQTETQLLREPKLDVLLQLRTRKSLSMAFKKRLFCQYRTHLTEWDTSAAGLHFQFASTANGRPEGAQTLPSGS